ncbi:MAG: NifU family protein [Dehalococcoidia bacterium]
MADGDETGPDDSPDDSPDDNSDAQRSVELKVSEAAVTRLKSVIEGYENAVAGIRIAVSGRGPQGFQHSLAIIEPGEEPEDDPRVEVDGITFFVEARNVDYLDGVAIEFDGGASGGMLQFENPNPLWRDPLSQKLQELFDTQLNPQIASHGGSVTLLEVDVPKVFIELGGGCVGCGMVDVTLKQGIEVAIKEAAPEITEVIDSTDHGSGDNPYYQPSKK